MTHNPDPLAQLLRSADPRVTAPLMLHAHVGQVAPQGTVAPRFIPRTDYTTRSTVPLDEGSYFRANNEDRPPDRGLRRHVLAHYTRDAR